MLYKDKWAEKSFWFTERETEAQISLTEREDKNETRQNQRGRQTIRDS